MSDVRPLAPFGRRRVDVTGVEQVGQYHLIEVFDGEAPSALPGQFHMLSAEIGWGGGADQRPWLPRAISFLESDGAGRFTFLVDPVGPGTEALCGLSVGDGMMVAGPFGNGFDLPAPDQPLLLVGGGVGAAPVVAQHQAALAAGVSSRLILGFRSSSQAALAERWSEAIVTTDDGSLGRSGSAIDPMIELLDGGETPLILACGPPGMLEAIRVIAADRGLDCRLALESPMACGFGACFGCAVETRNGIIRLCVDGPVLDAAELHSVGPHGRALA